jgi:hypothetical protein
MASKNFAGPDRSLNRGVVKVQGSVVGAGAADPTGRIGNGIAAVTRTALGRYLISFSGRYRRLLDFKAAVAPGITGTNAGTVALARTVNHMQPLNTTLSGRLVTQVEVYVTNNTGAEALTELAVGDLLTFEATFQNSTARPSRGR